MFRDHRICKLVLCMGLMMTAMMGAPIPPDEVADMLRVEQQTKIEMSVRKESEDTSGEDSDTSYGSTLRESVCSRCAASNEGVL